MNGSSAKFQLRVLLAVIHVDIPCQSLLSTLYFIALVTSGVLAGLRVPPVK